MAFVNGTEKTAIIYEEKTYSFRDVVAYAKGYKNLLNIQKEDRVVIFMENRPELLFAFLGIIDGKGTCVTLDASFSGEELCYFLKNSTPKYIFTSSANKTIVEKSLSIIGEKIPIICVDDKIEKYNGNELNIEEPERDSTILMLYTSGTTGDPKGIMLTYENLLTNIDGLDHYEMFLESDKFLALLPLHHILPLLGTGVVPLYKGATIVFLKDLSSEAVVEALKKYKITILIGVPRLWEMLHLKIMKQIRGNKIPNILFNLCEKIKSKSLSQIIFKKVSDNFGGNIRFFVSGGSKLDPQIAKDFLTLGIDMCEGYGLTETSPMISYNPIHQVVPGSAGIPLYNIEVKIADDGEILARGKNVMKGYFNMPEATKQAIDEDKWFHTGDLGELRDGRLYITGRKKEMIVLSSGKKINPEEIEIAISKSSPYIEEIAILNYDNKLTALILPNMIQIKKDKIASTNLMETLKWEITDKYNLTAPKYAKILDIKILKDKLPRTKLGKIRRFLLPDYIRNLENGSSTSNISEEDLKKLETPEYKALATFIQTLKKEEKITPLSYLELDLGLDSLDIVELLSFVETNFGITLREEEFKEVQTVGELGELIKRKGGSYSEENIDWKKILSEPVDANIPHSALSTKIVKILTAPIFKYYFKTKKEGSENIIPKPVIFAGNHQSLLDVFLLNQILSHKIMDDTYYVAISQQVSTPFRKFLAKYGNVLTIDINQHLRDTIKTMAQVLRSGKNIVIFPEGARTRDGELHEFKKSFAILSKELDIPVIPFGIKGTYESMPFGSGFPKRNPLEIKLFPAIYPQDLTVEQIVEKTKDSIQTWLSERP
jgi:long-chain acyl-CoA synthetase